MYTNNQLHNEIEKSKSLNHMSIELINMINTLVELYIVKFTKYDFDGDLKTKYVELCKYELYDKWNKYNTKQTKKNPIMYYTLIMDRVVTKYDDKKIFNIRRILKIKKIRKNYE